MTVSRQPRIPTFRIHKASGQGFVEVSGRRTYLGRFDLPETREKYHRLVATWLAGGHQLPTQPEDLTIVELIDVFWQHARTYYVQPDGQPAHEQDNYRLALKPLRELFGHARAADFGPKAMQTVMSDMVRRGWSRGVVNSQAGRVRRVFKWAASQELVPASCWHALQSVPGLRAGRTDAREIEPVGPVSMAAVEAVRPFVSKQVWALIQLQLLTGARGGEMVTLRCVDINMTGTVWTANLAGHKTAWRGHSRAISFGPKAQAVLRPFLAGRKVDAYLFSPQEAEAERRAALHAERATPMNEGNRPGTHTVESPEREPGDHYTADSYRRAIQRACDQAFPYLGESAAEREAWQKEHRWHPHQLRHTAAVTARAEFGPDAARALLGHRSLGATQIYAEIDNATVEKIVAMIG